jgi:hypothetical protein
MFIRGNLMHAQQQGQLLINCERTNLNILVRIIYHQMHSCKIVGFAVCTSRIGYLLFMNGNTFVHICIHARITLLTWMGCHRNGKPCE